MQRQTSLWISFLPTSSLLVSLYFALLFFINALDVSLAPYPQQSPTLRRRRANGGFAAVRTALLSRRR